MYLDRLEQVFSVQDTCILADNDCFTIMISNEYWIRDYLISILILFFLNFSFFSSGFYKTKIHSCTRSILD